MCGLFGFIGEQPDNKLLNQLARLACKRGPDGFGYFDGQKISRYLGKYQEQKYTSNIIIGHARLHTIIGTSKDIEFLQPIVLNNLVFTFNGALTAHDGRSDTEYFCRQISRHGIQKAAELCAISTFAVAFYSLKTKRFNLFAKGMELYVSGGESALYYCSKPFAGSELLTGEITK
jgi:asparagine synthetase B (glutamine-hydrolysing)